jgi:predicted permease
MSSLFNRLRRWFGRDRFDADLSEELETHRAMIQEQMERAGRVPVEAAHASRRILGNLTLAREDARQVWVWPWLDAARQDISYALRILRRNRGFAAALIVVTSLGIGAATTVFGMLDALVLKPLPVYEPERLVYFSRPAFSYPIYSELRARTKDVFSDLFAWSLVDAHVDWRGELEPTEVLAATGDFYTSLGIQPALGRFFGTDDDRVGGGPGGPAAVVSYRCWQERFGGDATILGRTVRINRVPFTIVGVAPRGFFGVAPGLSPELTIPLLPLQTPESLAHHSSAWLHIMGRLQPALRLEEANAALQRIWPQVLETTTPRAMPADRRLKYLQRSTTLEPGVAGFSRVRNQFADPLWLLLGLVGLLFVVACTSTTNLLLARGIARQRELAVRLAIGASRLRLIRQFMTESLVWTTLGAMAGLFLASWTGSVMVGLLTSRESAIVLDLAPTWRVSLFAAALALLAAVSCSIAPALRTTRSAGSGLIDTHQIVGGPFRRWSLGQWLLAVQMALTMVLLAGGALFVRSLLHVLSQDAGIDREYVLVVTTDPAVAGYEKDRAILYNQQLRERLARLPGVQSVGLSVMPPISHDDGLWTQSIAVDGVPLQPEDARYVYFNAVSPDYFNTVGIRLLHGRDFGPGDVNSSPRVVVINAALARRFFPGQNPVGRRVSIGRDARRQDLQIIGVVADAKYQRLTEDVRSTAYLAVLQQGLDQNVFAEVRSIAGTSSVAESVRREVRSLDPRVPLHIESVTDRIRGSLVRERILALLASTLGLAALILACAALYGLLAYAVSRQTREIGLRLALGAPRQRVIWMVMRDCLILTGCGVAVGLVATFALGRFARTLLFQISATDAASLVAAAGLMLSVAALAGLLPAMRASRVDPAVALKSE